MAGGCAAVIRVMAVILHIPMRSSWKWVFHGRHNCQHSVCIASIISGENGDSECIDLYRESTKYLQAFCCRPGACLLPQRKKEVSCYPLPGGHRNHVLPVPAPTGFAQKWPCGCTRLSPSTRAPASLLLRLSTLKSRLWETLVELNRSLPWATPAPDKPGMLGPAGQ